MPNSNYESNYLNLFDYYIYTCLDKQIAKNRRMKTTRVPPGYFELFCVLNVLNIVRNI